MTAFLSVDDYPEIAALADDLLLNRAALLDEADRLQGGFMEWPEPINCGGWGVFGVKWQGSFIEPTHAKAAREVIERHPKVFNAGYSWLKPGTEILPHHGYTSEVLRLHIPLLVPEGDCALCLEGECRQWVIGEPMLFDDTRLHSAHNRTQGHRLVLLADITKK